MRAILVVALSLSAGCFKLDATEIPETTVPYMPIAAAPDGWIAERFDLALTCPDGTSASYWVVYDSAADAREVEIDATPVAVIFHSGTFDYVPEPVEGDPLGNATFQETVLGGRRLELDWAGRRVLETLGLHPAVDILEAHTGALAAAFANAGIPSVLPTNCWADHWHNRSAVTPNDVSADLFTRDGRTAAEFGYLAATESFPANNPVDSPLNTDLDAVYLVGLGSGSRAVSELLTVRTEASDGSTTPTYATAGILLDSAAEDLRVYYDTTGDTWDAVETGLDRIFPGGRNTTMDGSLLRAPRDAMPERIAYVYASDDPWVPVGVHELTLERLQTTSFSEVWISEQDSESHVLTNADDTLAAQAVAFLTEGTIP